MPVSNVGRGSLSAFNKKDGLLKFLKTLKRRSRKF